MLLDLAAPASDRDAAALLFALDRNGDGGVSLEEFVESVSQAQMQAEREGGEQEAARQVREQEARQAGWQGGQEQQQYSQCQQQQQPQRWQPWQHRE